MLGELRLLRSALSELPDLVPSRPLQLLPPVPAQAEAGGALGWLRRLAAPVMAAGAGLALVGAVGFGAVVLGDTTAQIFQNVGSNLEAGGERGEDAPDAMSPEPAAVASGDQAPADEGPADEEAANSRDFAKVVDLDTPTTWLVLIAAGLLLLVTGLALRHAIQPRAG